MYIVSPLSQCASPEKRDKFLEHIAQIAPITLATEPNCYGYAWFLSAGDNDVVSSHWLRGFEVYASPEANQVEHRASEEYKAFRRIVGEEGLLANPSDLRFWLPTGIGFLTKRDQEVFGGQYRAAREQYIITDEFSPKLGAKEELFDILRGVAEAALNDKTVLSFWVQDRVGTETSTREEGIEDEVYIFLRCGDKESAKVFWEQTLGSKSKKVEHGNRRTTTWMGSGIGFLGR